MNYSALDLTWTIQRVDQRTPLGRNGAETMRWLDAAWERVSRYGTSTGPGERAGTEAIVRV